MADLEYEFGLAIDGVTPLMVERFQRMGIPNRVLFGARHYLGAARVATTKDGLFEFHDDGDLAWIVPAGRRDQDGVLVDVDDVVAFFRPRPRIWFLRLGAITLLGDEELDLSRWRREPFLLHETPLEYALAGGVGGCIVDWRRFDPRQYFDGHPAGVICATSGQGCPV